VTDLWCAAREPEEVEPPAPLVVMVHGSMDRGAAFARVAGHLRELPTVRYDRRGYGRSVGLGAPDIEGHAADLLAIVDDRPAVLVGHSLGGLITLAAAARRPDVVRSVLLFETPAPWADWWPRRSAGGAAVQTGEPGDAAEAFLRRMIGDERWEAFSPRTREERRAEGAALLADLRSARAGAPFDASAITVPVVVGRGTESSAHHREGAVRLAAALGAPEPFVIEGAGHGAHVSHHGAFADLVRRAVAVGSPA
jgi:pimeloyl-ACP methyl ester carboxylesterase